MNENESKILVCTCVSKYQDSRYGPQCRVHNSLDSTHIRDWRCTVCGNEK